jgi:glycosyltransferase involved in cell wall biosynthesis
MKQLSTIVLVSTTASTVRAFMLCHIKKLSRNYNLFIFCKDAFSLKKKVPENVSLININFSRKPNLINDFKTFLFLTYLIIKNKPILTISISPKAGFLTSLSSFITRVSYRIHWFTGQVWITKKGLARVFFKIIDKTIFLLSKHVFVDSYSQRNFLISNNIISKNKSSVLLNGSVGGVNLRKFKYNRYYRNLKRRKLQIPKEDFVFLYLGRINKDKGVVDLINAFKNIQGHNKTSLVLVGPIEDQSIEKLIKNNNKKIIYAGTTSTPEKWFSVGDIFCLPSYREGFGSVIIEAGSCSLPSLGSNIYGINDAIIKNQTGFLHKVGNIPDIQRKMLFVIRNKKLLKSYGQRARKRVKKNFEENLISKKLLEFINSRIG